MFDRIIAVLVYSTPQNFEQYGFEFIVRNIYQLKMRVLGVGVDLVKISRIQHILDKNYKFRFLMKVLHPQELEHFTTLTDEDYQGQYVASRWAAKEATVKAIGRRELVFAKTHITKDLNGKPYVKLEGEQNAELLHQLKISKIHISLAHQSDFAVAYALALTAI